MAKVSRTTTQWPAISDRERERAIELISPESARKFYEAKKIVKPTAGEFDRWFIHWFLGGK